MSGWHPISPQDIEHVEISQKSSAFGIAGLFIRLFVKVQITLGGLVGALAGEHDHGVRFLSDILHHQVHGFKKSK